MRKKVFAGAALSGKIPSLPFSCCDCYCARLYRVDRNLKCQANAKIKFETVIVTLRIIICSWDNTQNLTKNRQIVNEIYNEISQIMIHSNTRLPEIAQNSMQSNNDK